MWSKDKRLAWTVRGAGLSPTQCSIFSCLIKIAPREIIKLFDTYKQFENMSLEMTIKMNAHVQIVIFQDDVHVHLPPKYQLYAVHMCKQCQGHGIRHSRLLNKS